VKLIVTIPAFNEEESIGKVIQSIPRDIEGVEKVEVLVLDDGSRDKTVQEAKKAGAEHVISNKKNLGLARTFKKAITASLQRGAEIIVNTDADDQYEQGEIPALIKPLLKGEADIVIGDRQIKSLDHMPTSKKYGNLIGSWVVRKLSGTNVEDASSGFRAFTCEAARSFNLLSSHTYTHETIIQAANRDLVVAQIPIIFKKREAGESRLISGVVPHIKRSLSTIIRTILMYKAFKYLVTLGAVFMGAGFLGVVRFLYFFFTNGGAGHIQSLVISSVLISVGFMTAVMGILADLIGINRRIIEELGSKKSKEEQR
jgi:glycosyltransferase involved in cell wall biosynthesis